MYKCECGKEFDNPQAFNGHKSHCEIHLNSVGKTDVKERIKQSLKLAGKKANKRSHEKAELRELDKLAKWVSEQHTCEKCGKVMTEKYGSGRFCSRACANSRVQTEEINQKRRTRIKSHDNKTVKLKKEIYYAHPKCCKICGSILSYENRRYKFCSQDCRMQYLRESAIHKGLGGYTKGSHG